MPEVRRNQNFACGDCKRNMEEGEMYFVIDRIGYCIKCAEKEEISVLKDIGAELKK